MTSTNPLDSVAWSALTGRQAHLAVINDGARRFHPDFGVFAAIEDSSAASLTALAALVAAHGDVAFLEANPPIKAPGLKIASQDPGSRAPHARASV